MRVQPYAVNEDSVRQALDVYGLFGQLPTGLVRYASIREIRPGVVRVDVRGLTRTRRKRAQLLVWASLRAWVGGWEVLPVGVSYPWRPWRTWVTVTDPETYRDPE